MVYLIFSAGLKMLKSLKKTPFETAVLLTVGIAMTVLSLAAASFSSVFYILLSGTAGVLVYLIGKRKEGGRS